MSTLKDWFERVVLKEDPNAIASNVAQVLRFGKEHPYGEVTTEETIEALNVEMVKAYYQKYFNSLK